MFGIRVERDGRVTITWLVRENTEVCNIWCRQEMVDYYIGRSHLGGSCGGIPVIGNLSTSSVAYAASTSAKKLGEEIITSGAVLMKYQYINSTGQNRWLMSFGWT